MRSVPCGDVVSDTISIPPVQQAGAVCFRLDADHLAPEILLITSRRTGQWGIPKGTIEVGESSVVAALREAQEEAGVEGRIWPASLGRYFYSKGTPEKLHEVHVHGLLVEAQVAPDICEQSRDLIWASVGEAMGMVSNVELRFVLSSAMPMIKRFLPAGNASMSSADLRA